MGAVLLSAFVYAVEDENRVRVKRVWGKNRTTTLHTHGNHSNLTCLGLNERRTGLIECAYLLGHNKRRLRQTGLTFTCSADVGQVTYA